MRSHLRQRSKDDGSSYDQMQVGKQSSKISQLVNSSSMRMQNSLHHSMVSKSQGTKYIYLLTDKEEKPKVQMSYTNVDKPDETMNKEPFQGSFAHSIHLPHESHASAAPASGI